jgi:hypothetical protein
VDAPAFVRSAQHLLRFAVRVALVHQYPFGEAETELGEVERIRQTACTRKKSRQARGSRGPAQESEAEGST